jgi:hypothetical protein
LSFATGAVILGVLRQRGHKGSLWDEPGGGGKGVEFISLRRRRASVSCALVGTPFRRVL